jgi:hypothetical protein
MELNVAYSWLADLILITHVLFVVFVVLGLVLIYAGKFLSWRWVRNPWFRIVHLLGIGVVVLQSWFGMICPLTTWEMNLRAMASDTVYRGSFIGHWLGRLLYLDLPSWVFVVCYTAFGAMVLASWRLVRPRPFGVQADE